MQNSYNSGPDMRLTYITHWLLSIGLFLVGCSGMGESQLTTPNPEPVTTMPSAPVVEAAEPTGTATALSPTSLPATSTTLLETPSSLTSSTTPSLVEQAESDSEQDNSNAMEGNSMNIQIGDQILTVTLAENSSADALKKALSEDPITIDMHDYGSMEKVGPLGRDLPRNDEQITTVAGDIILYQGNAFVIYYAPNSWNFTRLGKINNVTTEELKEILGEGDVTITLSLP